MSTCSTATVPGDSGGGGGDGGGGGSTVTESDIVLNIITTSTDVQEATMQFALYNEADVDANVTVRLTPGPDYRTIKVLSGTDSISTYRWTFNNESEIQESVCVEVDNVEEA